MASEEQVDIRHYRVIFEAVEDVKAALSGLLKPRIEEQIMGSAEIRETFQVSRLGTVAGCYVSDGLIRRNAHVRVVRDSVLIYEGELGSLRRFKDDVREVQSGFECGLTVEDFNDIKVGDVIEAFELVETTRVL